MTLNPVTITPSTSFSDAIRLLREREIHHLPVVDKDGQPIGIVTQSDLLYAAPTTAMSGFELNYLLANLHVAKVMTSPPVTVLEDVPLEEAARLMTEEKVGCLPVMRDGHLVGIITQTDMFRTFVEILDGAVTSEASTAPLRVTVQVPDVRGELGRLAGVLAQQGGNICSVARFHGTNPAHVFLTFRLEGLTETTLRETLQAAGGEVIHLCRAA